MMDVLMIIVIVAIVIYPKQNTFIDQFKFKIGLKGFEVDVRTKEKNCPPDQDDSSNPN